LTQSSILSALLGLALLAPGSQSVSNKYQPRIEHPAYAGKGPVVAIDGAHNDYHTMAGSYAPFARLAAADGFQVRPLASSISAESLRGTDILVIANARGARAGAPAFTPGEIAALQSWLKGGGALFLIADHAPFADPVRPLAGALGVDMGGGFAAVMDGGRVTSQIHYRGRALGPHPIIAGRTPRERVRAATVFTGQSLSGPPGSTSLLILGADAVEVADKDGIEALRNGRRVPGERVGGRAQLVAFSYGKGRVVVGGEAAMFTAQRVRLPGGQVEETGLPVDDDKQLTLNILHWLSRLIG